MKMKKLLAILIVFVSLISGTKVKAQAFDKDTRQITAFIGGSDLFHIPVGYTFNSFIYPTTFEAGVEGEFGIHKYVGLGFVAELGGRGDKRMGYVGVPNYYYYTFYSEFNMAVGVVANFHFYQLIADKVSNGDKMHADKLDVYAGLNIGTGFAIHPTYKDRTGATQIATDALFFAGPQVGVHYFFTPKIAINGEVGWGKTWARVGCTFKLNK